MSDPTAFKLVQDALVAVLTAPPVIVPVVRAGFDGTGNVDQSTRQVEVRIVEAKGHTTLAGSNAPMTWSTLLTVRCKVRSAPGDLMDVALDEMVGLVHQRLAALAPAAIGATAIDLDPVLRWGLVDGQPAWAVVERRVTVTHETLGASLAPRP